MKKPELLAPAGNMEKLLFAFNYGADAVYLSGKQFGLRAFADNFTISQLYEAVKYAHKLNKKVYVTVNIFPRYEDIDLLKQYIAQLSELDIDAIIASDLGVVSLIQDIAPKTPIHISTQASCTNYLSANQWHKLGAKRIILARELSLDDISNIRKNTSEKLELEVFVHGSMCISYSGRCLLSNFLTNRSANHGECSQPCRWRYELIERSDKGEPMPIMEDSRGTYILNSKDICLIEHIHRLKDAGVDSYKIEGRMKSAYYVATVTNAYRKAIDGADTEELLNELGKAANREFTTGFLLGKNNDMQRYHSSKCTQTYEFVAVVRETNPDTMEAFIEQRNKFSVGDELEILSPDKPNISFKIQYIRNEQGETQDSAPHPQQLLYIKVPVILHSMDILRKKVKQ